MGFEWIMETCLACDNQTPAGTAYCSQTCRLADIERASCASSNSSPKSASSYSPPTSAPSNGFYLPPAYNFSSSSQSYTPRSSQQHSSSPATYSYSSSSSRHRSSMQNTGSNKYSSRPTLGSGIQNSHTEQYLSDQVAQELKDYANCFDQVRDLKRRMSIV